MANNVTYPGDPAATKTVATDDVSNVHYQYVKIADGTEDSTAVIKGDATYGLDVDVTRLIGGAAVPIKFSDGGLAES